LLLIINKNAVTGKNFRITPGVLKIPVILQGLCNQALFIAFLAPLGEPKEVENPPRRHSIH